MSDSLEDIKTNALCDHSYTYISEIPSEIQKNLKAPVILGVDEAGRGPVLGPMVYSVSYCLKTYSELSNRVSTKSDNITNNDDCVTNKSNIVSNDSFLGLRSHGFADSKTLSAQKRIELLERICTPGDELYKNIGWATRTLTAQDISKDMFKPKKYGICNLNNQAHEATINLIKDVISKGVNIVAIYVDTVGPPESYQKKLKALFPNVTDIFVEKKADSKYPIVSVASICAKVSRDLNLINRPETKLKDYKDWGCGYPSDSKTVTWLHDNLDPVFGWSPVVRFSWSTAKDLLVKKSHVQTVWEDDLEQKNGISSFFLPKKEENSDISWFGGKLIPADNFL